MQLARALLDVGYAEALLQGLETPSRPAHRKPECRSGQATER